MIPPKAIFVISVLISGLIFSPSYSFAQSNQDDNPLSTFLEFFSQLFSFDDDSEPVTEFRDAVIVQTSGTSSTDTTPNNIAPIANAGLNQTVLEFATVTLDGTSSTDVDGNIVSYLWTQLSGKQVVILSPTNASATFIAPEVSSSGEILEFSLAVVDNSSGTDTDDVRITVNGDDDQSGGGGSGDDPPVDDGPDEKDGKNKVTICHIPPGNPENAHLITVGEPAVLAHIAHGDTLEECPDDLSGEGSDDNSKKGNQNVKENKGNSGKGNSDKDENEKSNSGKDKNDDKKDNSGKGNSGVNNSGEGNQNDNDENKKSNSEKGNKNDNENKSNSKLKNNNDDEAKDEDIEHDDDDDEDKDEHEDEDDDEDDEEDEDDDDDEDEDD